MKGKTKRAFVWGLSIALISVGGGLLYYNFLSPDADYMSFLGSWLLFCAGCISNLLHCDMWGKANFAKRGKSE